MIIIGFTDGVYLVAIPLNSFKVEKKLTQVELARLMGISQPSLSDMLRKKREIYIDEHPKEINRIQWYEVKRRAFE